jgi:hypothetical protein
MPKEQIKSKKIVEVGIPRDYLLDSLSKMMCFNLSKLDIKSISYSSYDKKLYIRYEEDIEYELVEPGDDTFSDLLQSFAEDHPSIFELWCKSRGLLSHKINNEMLMEFRARHIEKWYRYLKQNGYKEK